MKRTVRAQTPPMPIYRPRLQVRTRMTQARSEYPDKATVPWEVYRCPTFAILSADAARKRVASLTANPRLPGKVGELRFTGKAAFLCTNNHQRGNAGSGF